MGIYVTDEGFQPKTFDELLLFHQGVFTDLFGAIDFTVDSAFSQITRFYALRDAESFQVAQEIYTSRDLDQATGTSLDLIAKEKGVIRVDSSATEVINAILYGDDSTVIPSGSTARQTSKLETDEGEELLFALTENVTILNLNAQEIQLIPNSAGSSASYIITIDGNDYQYNSDPEESIGDIIDAFVDEIFPGVGLFAGTAENINNEYLKVQQLTTESFSVSVTSNLTVQATGSYGDFRANITGPNIVPAETLNEIVTPVSGWDFISNPTPGNTGGEAESDTEFRLRIAKEFRTGKATDEAILQNLLNDTENVSSVSVTSNRELATDGNGIPGKAFEVVISGGDDDDIANNIWLSMPAGIKPHGTTIIVINDSQGNPQTVRFSRPILEYIHVKVQRAPNTEEVYPGDEFIKQAIVDWSLTEFDNGTDVVRQKIGIPVYEVPGTEEIDIFIDSTVNPGDTPTYAQPPSISISGNSKANFDISRIIVEALP